MDLPLNLEKIQNCFQFDVNPYMSIGSGIEFGVGYKLNKQTQNSTVTFSAGFGRTKVLGVQIDIQKEPNLNHSKKHKPS